MDLVFNSDKTFSEKIDTSLKIVEIAYNESKEQEVPLFVNFSGGKDSTACLLLAKEVSNENVEAIYMSSGIEIPGTIEYVQKEAERHDVILHVVDPVKHYMGDFAHWVRHYGYFPSFRYNFCSSRLKIRASRRYLRGIHGRKHMYRLNGVRQPESARRKKMYKDTPFIIPDRDLSGSFMVFPILEWKSEDVKEYLTKKKVEIHKQYQEFGVSGCAYCPYYTEDIYYRILSVFPNIYDDIIKLEEEVGKPAVQRNVYLKDLKENFEKNKNEILGGLMEIKDKKG